MQNEVLKMNNGTECDVCGKKTNFLVDYYVVICQDCKKEYYPYLQEKRLQRIGQLARIIDDLKTKKSKY